MIATGTNSYIFIYIYIYIYVCVYIDNDYSQPNAKQISIFAIIFELNICYISDGTLVIALLKIFIDTCIKDTHIYRSGIINMKNSVNK